MADTIRKSINLVGTTLKSVPIEPLGPLTPVEWSPLAAVMRAQDSLCGTANRVLARVGLAGSGEFPVDDSLALISSGQNYPDADTWRTIWGPIRRRQTPGTQLAAHVIYLPSGMTQRDNGLGEFWPDGARGGVRVMAHWTNGTGVSDGPTAFELDLVGSNLADGAEPAGNGGAWAALREGLIEEIRPEGYGTDPEIAEDFSEWGPGSYASAATKDHDVELEIQIRGGARLVEVIVYEVPLSHVEDHDTTDPQSVHAFWAAGGPPLTPQTPVPQVEAADGPTYEEHRFGLRRLIETADWQSQRLGPAVLDATSWVSQHGEFDLTPWSTSSTTLVDLVSGASSYGGAAGWIVSGAYAKPHAFNNPDQIMAGGGRGVIPVRVRVLGRTISFNGGVVRVQSSAHEWIDVAIGGGHGGLLEYTAVGFLTAQVHPDHATATVQVLGLVNVAFDTLEVSGVAIDFGAW